METYTTFKYDNVTGNSHQLDDFDSADEAIRSAKALHHPDWPSSQGIVVSVFKNMSNRSKNRIFDTNKR